MKLIATLTALSFAATTFAQSAPSPASKPATFADPANLRGERVTPRDGRELPIDGGQGNNALGLQQMLRRLATRASILNIVAHPDDEDGGMLTYYARGMGARVADLSLTRGEGGQNAMTGDFEDALGLLRTQELLANDRYTGVTQMFGTEVDFGFSKTKSEAFAKWTHERVLYDAVRAIRLYRPLVITSTWTGNPTDGHGQHQVSGEIAQEAFVAAGDPTVFPELTAEGIFPWQPLRMYARVSQQATSDKGLFDYATGQYVPAKFTNYITGVTTTTPPSVDVIVHEGAQDPLFTRDAANAANIASDASLDPDTPFSYVQFARIGLGQQKSQIGPGFHIPRPGAAYDVAYHLYGSKVPPCMPATTARHPERSAQREAEGPAKASVTASCPAISASGADFFTGIDTSLRGISSLVLDNKDLHLVLSVNLGQAQDNLAEAVRSFDAAHPEAIAPLLNEALGNVDRLIHQFEGLNSGVLQAEQEASVLHELRIKRIQLNDALTLSLGLNLAVSTDSEALPANQTAAARVHVTESSQEPVLFHAVMSENSRGRGTAQNMDSNEDEAPPRLAHGQPVDTLCGVDASQASNLTRPYFTRDSLEAPVYKLSNEALREAPAAPPAVTCHALVTYKDTLLDLAAVATHHLQPAAFVPPATIAMLNQAQILPQGEGFFSATLSATPSAATTALQVPPMWHIGTPSSVADCKSCTSYLIEVPGDKRQPETISATASLNGKTVGEGYRAVGYGDLPRTNFYKPATVRIVPVDLKLPSHHRIAYLPGTGDAVSEVLASIGIQPTMLTIADVNAASLARFDTVVLGVRTYAAHPDLHGAPTQALLDFARNGGNVLVQYQTPEFTAADAPYPLSLGANEKVVDETAPVVVLHPESSLLNTPNQITATDFNGWIEERGHGFLSEWDPRYIALTETHDPGAPSEDVAPQAPQRGGLITTQLGEGRWTYCAFALYRQLPEAVPGAWRLFMNLINP